MLDHERKRISLPPIFWKKIGKSTLKIRIHVPLSKGYFKTPPLPCPAALRGVVYKIEAEAKGEYISPSSSVFCAAKHRGGVRRTEGVKNRDSNKIKYQTLPCRVPQHCGVSHSDRGSAQRARGLKYSDSKKIRYQTPPLPCLAALRDATKQ